jgi:hypothetical protein
LAPSGGWLRAGRASKGPQGPITLALSRNCGSRWRVRFRGERMPQTQIRPSPVEVSAPGSRGGKSSGVAAPGPWTRETVCEAEATLQKRVAVEAEAGEVRSPTPVRGGGKGVR